MLAAGNIDIVAVCIRGSYHFPVMQTVLEARPKAVFLEKPPTCSLTEMDALVSQAHTAGVSITVSYSRHWNPHVLRLEELVREGLIGEVKRVVAYCGGDVLSFASHTTDLICQFAGYNPTHVYTRGRIPDVEVRSGYEAEAQLDTLVIEFAGGQIGVQVGGDGEHGGMYCDVFGTEGRVRVGMYLPPFVADKNNKPLDLASLNIPLTASVFTVAYDQIASYLDGGPVPACTNDAWQVVNEIGFAAIESLHRGERVALPNTFRERRVWADG